MSSENWRKYKLGDVIDIKHGFAFKGEYFSETPTKDILLTPGNFKIRGGFNSDKFKYYDGVFTKDYVLQEGDIIVTMTDLSKKGDTLGYSAKIPSHEGKNYLHNQRLGLLIFKNKNFDRNFIYWLLRTKEYQNFIVNSATGSTVKHTSPTRIKEYEFYAPKEKALQSKLAFILSSLEDKIELNLQTNQTLENIAKVLFQEMCVPKTDRTPDGWITLKLRELMEVKYGKDHKKLDDGDTPVYGSGGIIRYVDKVLYEKESILIPRKGSLHNIMYVSTPFWSVDTMFYTIVKRKIYTKFLYFFLKAQNLASMNVGSAVPSMTAEILNNLEVVVPPEETLKRYTEITDSLFKKIDSNNNETETLTGLRDSLLPNLMKGKVSV